MLFEVIHASTRNATGTECTCRCHVSTITSECSRQPRSKSRSEHPDLIESAVYENIDRFGNPLLDASGSYEVPPDATSSGRYENLTDSLRPIENSSSGVYDYPAELDRQPFRRRVVGNASSLSRPQSPKPAKVSRFLGRTI